MTERLNTPENRDFPGGPVVRISPSNVGLIPGQISKIPRASWPENQNRRQKQYCNKYNKDFNNCPHQKNKDEEETQENSFSLFLSPSLTPISSHTWEQSKEAVVWVPGRKLSHQKPNQLEHWTSHFQSGQKNVFLWFKPPSLWGFVMAAPAD